MKLKVKTVLQSLLVSYLTITTLYAQGTYGKHHEHFKRENLCTVYGKVTQFTANDNYIIEGFVLNSSAGTYQVKFPAYMGSKVIAAVKTGSNVSVSGFVDSVHGDRFLRIHSILLGKRAIRNTSSALADMKASETFVKVSGTIKDYCKDKEGKINGFMLHNKTLVQFPADMGSQVTNVVSPGSQISIEGLQRILSEGEVQLEKWYIVGASVISAKGQEYLVR